MFDNLVDILQQVADLLQDVNSVFPETQTFLQSRGLTHVRQLDDQGMKDLQRYLQMVLIRESRFNHNGSGNLNDSGDLFE